MLLGTAGLKHFELLNAEPYAYDAVVNYHDMRKTSMRKSAA